MTIRQLEGLSTRAWRTYQRDWEASCAATLALAKADKRRWESYAKAITAGRAVATAKDREAASKQR